MAVRFANLGQYRGEQCIGGGDTARRRVLRSASETCSLKTRKRPQSAEGSMPKGMFGHSNRVTSLVAAEKCRMDGWPASPTRNLSPLFARKQNVTNMSGFFKG